MVVVHDPGLSAKGKSLFAYALLTQLQSERPVAMIVIDGLSDTNTRAMFEAVRQGIERGEIVPAQHPSKD